MELTFDFTVEKPKSHRTGVGREGEPWETHLDPLRQQPMNEARVFTFVDRVDEDGKLTKARSQAATRVAVIASRLRKKCPKEEWRFSVRELNEDGTEAGLWITFAGTMTDDEYKAYLQKRQERSEKIKAGRNKTASGHEAKKSPAERVKEAREAAKTA